MSVRIFSAALSGIDAQLIEVEVDSSPGIHSFSIVGLPDTAVKESKERIGAAIKNSGFSPPKSKTKKVVINLAPADIKKEGPSYDLPIAVGYLFETGQIKFNSSNKLFAGELALDGKVKSTAGILAMAILAKKLGFEEVIIPSLNANEASIVEGIKIIGVQNLGQVLAHLDRTAPIRPSIYRNSLELFSDSLGDSFTSIKGQAYAKRALTVAASGAHNIFMSGPPGSGKTLLAKSITDILPLLSPDESLEVAKIYSSMGFLSSNAPLSFRRPFMSPHHTTSAVAIIGGGKWPKPGEISLAHRGVLFLDELPEFPRNVLEALRQPLEDGTVVVSRAAGSVRLPAKFMLVAAMNPCPCGNYGNPNAECTCLPYNVLKYRKKVSGPLLDRIDIQINVPRETISEGDEAGEEMVGSLDEIRAKIAKARHAQLVRFRELEIFSNAEMNYKNVEKLCIAEKSAKILLKKAINSRGLSLRAYHRTLKVARTIADLEESETVKDHHVAEALGYRISENMINELG